MELADEALIHPAPCEDAVPSVAAAIDSTSSAQTPEQNWENSGTLVRVISPGYEPLPTVRYSRTTVKVALSTSSQEPLGSSPAVWCATAAVPTAVVAVRRATV